MTSKFQYQKICITCGKTFTAQKCTTKYCSTPCAKRGYKTEMKAKRQQNESDTIKERNLRNLLSQEFLSISSAAELLSISRPTLYKMIAAGEIKTIRASERIVRIRRTDLEQMGTIIAPINTPIPEIAKAKEEYIGIPEAVKLLNVSLTWFYKKIKTADIQSTIIEGKAMYPLKSLKKLFNKNKHAEIAEWYTVAEIVEKFGVTKQCVYEYTSDHKMPKKREGQEVLISKHHWEQSRGLTSSEKEDYYTVPEASEKYNIGRSHMYDLIGIHKIPKIKKGKIVLIHRQTVDNIMINRKK